MLVAASRTEVLDKKLQERSKNNIGAPIAKEMAYEKGNANKPAIRPGNGLPSSMAAAMNPRNETKTGPCQFEDQ